jgi:hypothetical protein
MWFTVRLSAKYSNSPGAREQKSAKGTMSMSIEKNRDCHWFDCDTMEQLVEAGAVGHETPLRNLSADDEGGANRNAKLIAAAPDLLSACKRQIANIERWLETGAPASPEESKSIYDQMVAAVAKAEGR